jgi:peptidyl-tRNA hydrolase
MSQLKNEDNSQTQSEVADDWENVGDEQVMAQIAERQKQLVEQKNEVEQLKLPEADDGQQPGPAKYVAVSTLK